MAAERFRAMYPPAEIRLRPNVPPERAEVARRELAALITYSAPFGEWPRGRGGREYRGVRTRRYTYVCTRVGHIDRVSESPSTPRTFSGVLLFT